MVTVRSIAGYSRKIHCHHCCSLSLKSIVNNTRKGYKLDNGFVLNRLEIITDYLKLYGNNEKETVLYTV